MADAVVAAGAPLVLGLYGHGQFEWFDGDDAHVAWSEARPYVIATQPTAKQLAKHVMWTAGLWDSDDGQELLYLSGRC